VLFAMTSDHSLEEAIRELRTGGYRASRMPSRPGSAHVLGVAVDDPYVYRRGAIDIVMRVDPLARQLASA